MCHGNLNDLNQPHLIPYMLSKAGLPPNIDDIPVDEGVPAVLPPEPHTPEFNEDVIHSCDEMLQRGDYTGFANMLFQSQLTQVTPPHFQLAPHDHEAGTSQAPQQDPTQQV
jgi:hypothetical protein